MPAGEGFSSTQQFEIDRAIRAAEMASRREFSVYVGPTADRAGDAATFARKLHAALTNPEISVLVLVDPDEKILEIVTGTDVRRQLDDDTVGLAAVAMQASFADGDLVGGITRGVTQLGEAAARTV